MFRTIFGAPFFGVGFPAVRSAFLSPYNAQKMPFLDLVERSQNRRFGVFRCVLPAVPCAFWGGNSHSPCGFARLHSEMSLHVAWFKLVAHQPPGNCRNKGYWLGGWLPYDLPKLCRKKWRVDHNIRFLRVEVYDRPHFGGIIFLFSLSCCFYVWVFVVQLLLFCFVVVVCSLLFVVGWLVGWLVGWCCCCCCFVVVIVVVLLLLLLLFCCCFCWCRCCLLLLLLLSLSLLLLLLLLLLLVLLFCCYCCCLVYLMFCYLFFVFVVLVSLLLFLLLLLLFLLFVCPKTPQQINKKQLWNPCFIVFFPFVPWRGFAQREANNPKQQKKQKLCFFLFCFSSLLCFFMYVFHFFLLFLLYLPDGVYLFIYFVFFLSHFLPFILFSFSSSFSFELQRSRRRKRDNWWKN